MMKLVAPCYRSTACAVLLLACSICAAGPFQADAPSQEKAVKVRLVIRDFRHSEKSPDLDTIGGFLPGLLRASLFHYRWIDVTAGGSQADAGQLKGSVSTSDTPTFLEDAGPLKETTTATSDTPMFWVDGSLVMVKDKVRLNLSATAASNNALVFSKSAVFAGDAVVQEVDALAAKMADALATRVGAAGRSGSLIAVVSPFQAQGEPGKFQALSTLVPDTLVTLLSRAQRETGKPADTRFSEITQASAADAYDAVLTGSYSTDAGELMVRAELREKRGPALSFSFRMAPLEAIEIPDFLARRVSELLVGRIAETGNWKQEPLLTAADTSYAAVAAEAARRLQEKDYSRGIVLYRKAIELQPRELSPRLDLAEIYLAQKDYAAALSEYAEVLRLDPGSARAVYGTGNAALAQGKNQQAAAAFRKALTLAPKDRAISIGSYKGLGDLELLQGQYDQAVLQYESAQRIAESSPRPETPAGAADTEIYRSIGKAYLAGGQTQKAIAYLASATRRFPASAEVKNDLAAAHIESAGDLAQAGKYPEAQNAFRSALAILSENAALRPSALIGLGDSLSKAGNSKEALQYLRQAVSLDPKNEHGFRALGEVYVDLRQYDDAVAALQKAIAIEPTVYSYELLGECYRNKGQYDLAEESLRDALRLSPTSYTAYVTLAQVYFDNKKFDLALENLQRAVVQDPKQEYAYFGMAQTYGKQNDFPRAIENQNTVVRISPTARNYYWLARFYQSSKNYGSALDALRKSIAVDPDYQFAYDLFRAVSEQRGDLGPYRELLKSAMRTNPTAAWLHAKLGREYYDAGQYRESIPPLSRAVSLASDESDLERLLGVAYHKTGQLELAISALEKAILANVKDSAAYDELESVYNERREPKKYLEFLTQLVAKEPGSLSARVRLGKAYQIQHEYDKAIEVLTQATSIDAKSEWPWRVLGVTYELKQDYEKALAMFGKANDLKKTKWSFQEIAVLLRTKGEYDKALENVDQALKIDDQYTDAYTTKAAILFDQKKLGDAIALLEGAALKLPSSPEIRASLAWYYGKAHDYGKAADSISAALAISPRYAPAYNVLASVQEEQNEYGAALESVRKAIEYDPANEESYSTLREIYHQSGRDAEVVQALRQFLGKQPDNIGLLSALGFAEHEYVSDFAAAYEHFDKAYQLDKNRLTLKENFAEASLTHGRFDQALKLARTVLVDRSLSPQEKLSLNLVSIAAQLLLGNRGSAFSEVGEFLLYYRSIPEGYERTWSYDGTKKYVNSSSLAPAEKQLLLKLIETLEASKEEREEKAKGLENSLNQRLHELAQ